MCIYGVNRELGRRPFSYRYVLIFAILVFHALNAHVMLSMLHAVICATGIRIISCI